MAQFNPSPEETAMLVQKGALSPETAKLLNPEIDYVQLAREKTSNELKSYQSEKAAKELEANKYNEPTLAEREDHWKKFGTVMPTLKRPEPVVAQEGPAPASVAAQSPNPEPSVIQSQGPVAQAGSSPFSSGYAQAKKAIDAQVKVGTLVAAEKLGAAEEIARAADQRQQQMLVDQAEKDKQLAEGEAKRQEASDAVKNFKFQDYWADRSTGSKIGAALAMAFGAYAQSINGGPNTAMQIVDDAVKRDMDLQQKKYDQVQGSAKEADNAYGRLYKVLGDKDLAKQQGYISSLEAIKAKGDASLAKLGGEQAKAQGMQSMAEIQMKIDSAKAEYGLKIEELGAKKRTAQAGMQENLIPALGVYATSKEGASKMNELAGATRSAQDGIGQLLALTNESGKSLSPETRARAETTASIVKASLRVPILGPGTVNDAERAIMDKIVSNPATLFSLDEVSKVRLKSLSERLEANLSQQAKAYTIPSGPNQGTISTGMIKVRLPDGRVGAIPADKIQKALGSGAEIIR